MQEINKFDAEIKVMSNGLENYMAFTINNFFFDSMQFMNSSLDTLVKNLPDNDFEYLSQKFKSKPLKLVNQKWVYPYEYMSSFEKFFEDKLRDRSIFYSSLKNECISKKIIYMLIMFGICLKWI